MICKDKCNVNQGKNEDEVSSRSRNPRNSNSRQLLDRSRGSNITNVKKAHNPYLIPISSQDKSRNKDPHAVQSTNTSRTKNGGRFKSELYGATKEERE